jgi:hypothetical protein
MYDTWQKADATRALVSNLKPLLESPLDHRLTSLCGETFIANLGCTTR